MERMNISIEELNSLRKNPEVCPSPPAKVLMNLPGMGQIFWITVVIDDILFLNEKYRVDVSVHNKGLKDACIFINTFISITDATPVSGSTI